MLVKKWGRTAPLSFFYINIHYNGYAIANIQLNSYVESLSLHMEIDFPPIAKIASNMDVLQQSKVCFSLSGVCSITSDLTWSPPLCALSGARKRGKSAARSIIITPARAPEAAKDNA